MGKTRRMMELCLSVIFHGLCKKRFLWGEQGFPVKPCYILLLRSNSYVMGHVQSMYLVGMALGMVSWLQGILYSGKSFSWSKLEIINGKN